MLKIFKVSEETKDKCRLPTTRIELRKYNIILAPLILTPHASILSATSDDDIPMKSKQQLENEPHLMPEDTESSNVSSTTTLHEENQSNKMPIQSIIKEKSSSKERTSHMEVANTAVSKVNDNFYMWISIFCKGFNCER